MSLPDQSKLKRLLVKATDAKAQVEAELMRLYPRNTDVGFTIMHGQRRASTGTVLGLGFHLGYIRVLHHQARDGGRYQYREVHWESVLWGGED